MSRRALRVFNRTRQRRRAATSARELRADMDQAPADVDVVPGQAQQLRLAHAGVKRRRDQCPVGRQASIEQPLELLAAEDAVRQAGRVGTLVGFQLVDTGLSGSQALRTAKRITH